MAVAKASREFLLIKRSVLPPVDSNSGSLEDFVIRNPLKCAN